jgi:hypothetical protein
MAMRITILHDKEGSMLEGDFKILAVEFDRERKKVVRMLVSPHLAATFGEPLWVDRDSVFGLIENQSVFVIPGAEGDSDQKPVMVRIVRVGWDRYLQAEGSAGKGDLLGRFGP